MLTFTVDKDSPLSSLEDCAYQIEMFVGLLSNGSSDGIMMSDYALTGMCSTLRAVYQTIHRVHELVLPIVQGQQARHRDTAVPATPQPPTQAAFADACDLANALISARPESATSTTKQACHPAETKSKTSDTLPKTPRLTKPKRSEPGRRAAA